MSNSLHIRLRFQFRLLFCVVKIPHFVVQGQCPLMFISIKKRFYLRRTTATTNNKPKKEQSEQNERRRGKKMRKPNNDDFCSYIIMLFDEFLYKQANKYGNFFPLSFFFHSINKLHGFLFRFVSSKHGFWHISFWPAIRHARYIDAGQKSYGAS